MFVPKQKTVYELEFSDFSELMFKHLPTVEQDIFTEDGPQYYLVDVSDDIHEPEEWREELLNNYEPISPRESIADYLSLLCYDKVIPPGEYLVSIFW